MSGFDAIFSQDQPIRTLTRFLQKETIPHALLFTGIEGVGKRMTAMTFAMAANCLGNPSDSKARCELSHPEKNGFEEKGLSFSRPCDECSSCKKIRSHHHPDILFIEPSGSMIKINQIRDLFRTLALKPYEARIRMVIISESHTMNDSAANALLKILEEPPDRTVLILTANETSDLLPTIVSRCRHIRFSPLSNENIVNLLEKNRQLEPGHANILSAMAGGSYTRALSMSRSNWIGRRQWLMAAGGLENPDKLSERPLCFWLAFSEQLTKSRSTLEDSLEVIKTWFRDLLIWKYTPDKIINQDLGETIRQASGKSSVKELIKKIDAVEQTLRDLKKNMNVRLCLDILMLKLASK